MHPTLGQLIDGLVFTVGPVARALDAEVPMPPEMSQKEKAEYKEARRRLKRSMISADEKALRGAIPQLQSGNPYSVEKALKVFGRSFDAALTREYPEIQRTAPITPRCGLVAVCAAVSVAAIALGAAIAAVTFNVAGTVNIIYNQNGFWDGKKKKRSSAPAFPSSEEEIAYPGLSETETVALITETLRSA